MTMRCQWHDSNYSDTLQKYAIIQFSVNQVKTKYIHKKNKFFMK